MTHAPAPVAVRRQVVPVYAAGFVTAFGAHAVAANLGRYALGHHGSLWELGLLLGSTTEPRWCSNRSSAGWPAGPGQAGDDRRPCAVRAAWAAFVIGTRPATALRPEGDWSR